LGLSVLMSVFAAPIQRYTAAAALQLQDRAAYAGAVLPESGGAAAQTTRPYRGVNPPLPGASKPAPAEAAR
jgi:multicomponent K+:H+ antiporter subunit D